VKKENVELQWAANRTMERVDIGIGPAHYKITAD
jgi:hypothetical protein